MYRVEILKDSISVAGKRITTWELEYPRMVHAEFMTHRLFSRNAASSRAIPIEKMLSRVETDPAKPVWWGKNQSGMQALEELQGAELEAFKAWWLEGMEMMVAHARKGAALGGHKQIVNRIVEPWMFITVVMTTTEHDNWFHLRDHWQAQPEIAWVAKAMHELWKTHVPDVVAQGHWHLPLIREEDWTEAIAQERYMDKALELLKKVSTGRCARVSYLTHDGRRDLAEDVKLHDRLLAGIATDDPLHMSPFEHVATPCSDPTQHDIDTGNFWGWEQYRKEVMRSEVR